MATEAGIELLEGIEEVRLARPLVIVDYQHDFYSPDGALYVQGGETLVPLLVEMIEKAPLVVATRDWHPADHSSFIEQGGTWPVHCVAGTEGAMLHNVVGRKADVIVDKGQTIDGDGYSATEGTVTMCTDKAITTRLERLPNVGSADLMEVLDAYWDTYSEQNGLSADEHYESAINVVGLATDYCVKATAIDLASEGFDVHVKLEACKGVGEPTVSEAIEAMIAAGVTIE